METAKNTLNVPEQTVVSSLREMLMNCNQRLTDVLNAQELFFERLLEDTTPKQGSSEKDVSYGGVRGLDQELDRLELLISSIEQETARLNKIA